MGPNFSKAPSLRHVIVLLSVVAGLVAVNSIARPTRVARIPHQGKILSFPLPIWSVRIEEGEGFARYLSPGDPTFSSLLGSWQHLEQFGSAHTFMSEGIMLEVLTQKRTRWLTEMRLTVLETADQPPPH